MLDLLISLSAAGQELQAVAVSDDTTGKLAIVQRLVLEDGHIAQARKLAISNSEDVWSQLQSQKIVMADLARAFAAIMALGPEAQALQAAAIYTSLLRTPGCPVGSFPWLLELLYLDFEAAK